ncbi:ABC transporter permease subunit [uncultured Selenomonas sp.]|uniref:ABC transporter permease subunit n=1 Tax=uncultured Selenomonas sp. TaxID=159275 RepID=UPI00344E4A9F
MNAKVQNEIAKIGLWLVGCFILGLLAAFLGYILYKGLPVLNLHFIFGKSSDILAGGGVGSQLFNSFYMLFLSMAVSIPLTLVLLNLPMLVRVTEESIRTVPHDYEEASLALGATKLQTVFKVILPSAMPGIITGIGALLILTILVFNFLLVLPLKYFQRHSVGR